MKCLLVATQKQFGNVLNPTALQPEESQFSTWDHTSHCILQSSTSDSAGTMPLLISHSIHNPVQPK